MIESKLNADGRLELTKYEGSDAVVDLSNENIEVIGKKVFLSCKSVKKIILPASIKRIEDWAFSKCTSLKTVEFMGEFTPDIFQKGVFDGCSCLTSIGFKDSSKALKTLLAATANRLYNEHLLCSDDVGEQSWYEKWDLFLMDTLDNEEYEENEKRQINKCFLCFERLFYDDFLKDEFKKRLENYLKGRAFKKSEPFAWITLKEECPEKTDYFKIYLDIVKPDTSVINEMVADMDSTMVMAKSFLIGEASKKNAGDDFFDDLLL